MLLIISKHKVTSTKSIVFHKNKINHNNHTVNNIIELYITVLYNMHIIICKILKKFLTYIKNKITKFLM